MRLFHFELSLWLEIHRLKIDLKIILGKQKSEKKRDGDKDTETVKTFQLTKTGLKVENQALEVFLCTKTQDI